MKASTLQLLNQFKVLADPVRTRLVAICRIAECSVSELTSITGLSQPRISQHVKQLCDASLLERFKDGHFVYYRAIVDGAKPQRQLLALLPDDEPQFAADLNKLRSLREASHQPVEPMSASDRSLYQVLVELSVAHPLGDLLDIGCGQGRILKLLASRAHRCVGVDIDSDARRLARAEVLLAGSPNTTLRQGDMTALPFADEEFDTVILDDVLGGAKHPDAAVAEAKRVLKPSGRLLVLEQVDAASQTARRQIVSQWAARAGLRLAAPRIVPAKDPAWLIAVATPINDASVAA